MANPYALPRDTTIAAPTEFQVFHHEGMGSFTRYRWLYVTAIINGKESAVSNIGDVNGDTDPGTAALATWAKQGSPTKFRVYVFNCTSGAALFDPQLNQTSAGMTAVDGSTPFVRFKELSAVPNNHGPWPPDTENLTHELLFTGDQDGTDYWAGQPTGTGPTGTLVATPTSFPTGGGSVNLTWTSQNADTARLLLNGANSEPVALNGAGTRLITTSTIFSLVLVGPGGTTTLTDEVLVDGTPPPPPPTANPTVTAEGVKVTARMIAAVNSTQALLIGAVSVDVSVVTAEANSTTPTAVVDADFTAAQLDALEFGVERKTAGGIVTLYACCAEVLHGTEEMPEPAWKDAGSSYQQRVGSYVGNGGFQTISGVGFHPRAVLVKKLVGTDSPGALRTARLGGTVGRVLDSATVSTDAIQSLTTDGFDLGPDASVNETGITYLYVAFQDGQGAGAGPYFCDEVYWRYNNGVTSRIVPIRDIRPDLTDWTPETLLVGGNSALILKTPDMAVADALPLRNTTVVTNLITALGARSLTVGQGDSFQLEGGVNSLLPIVVMAWKNVAGGGDLEAEAMTWGTFMGAGIEASVSGIPFVPVFYGVGHAGAAFADRFRHRTVGVGGTTSYTWADGNTNVDGITAVATDGFTVAAATAPNGVAVHWFVWKETVDFTPPDDDDDNDDDLPPGEIDLPPEAPFPCGGHLCLAPPTQPGQACKEPRP